MFSPKTITKAANFVETARGSKDAMNLFNRFSGCKTPQAAYDELKKLSDYDFKVIAVLISRAANA